MSPNVKNKQLVWDFFSKLSGSTPDTVCDLAKNYFADDVVLDCAHPINRLSGIAQVCEKLWSPMLSSFKELAVRPYIFFGGKTDGSEDNGKFENTEWVSSTGYYEAVFEKDFLDIPASGKVIFLRYCSMFRMEGEKIVYGRIIFDFLDLLQQLGIYFIKAQGNDRYIPGPYSMDGIILGETEEAKGQKTIKAVRCMGKSLDNFADGGFDGMSSGTYFAEDFNWFGPGGIGACKGIENYEKCHQIPFLNAFPDRGQYGLQKLFYVGEENYCCVGAWCESIDDNPSAEEWFTTHTGEYLGIPATGKKLGIRCYDFYRVDEKGMILENWVIYDLIHFINQMGFDVFARLREKRHYFKI